MVQVIVPFKVYYNTELCPMNKFFVFLSVYQGEPTLTDIILR